MPEPGNTMTPIGITASIWSLRRNGAALAWRIQSGLKAICVTLRALAQAAAMIDSRDFIAAKRRSETEVLLPPGPKVAFTGGLDFNDHRAIWDRLDQVHAKHPGMVLLHGGSPKGAERIAGDLGIEVQINESLQLDGEQLPAFRASLLSAMT